MFSIRAPLYCSYCAKYEHLTTNCLFYKKESIYIRQSEDDIRKRFMENSDDMILEIKDNDKVIILYLLYSFYKFSILCVYYLSKCQIVECKYLFHIT